MKADTWWFITVPLAQPNTPWEWLCENVRDSFPGKTVTWPAQVLFAALVFIGVNKKKFHILKSWAPNYIIACFQDFCMAEVLKLVQVWSWYLWLVCSGILYSNMNFFFYYLFIIFYYRPAQTEIGTLLVYSINPGSHNSEWRMASHSRCRHSCYTSEKQMDAAIYFWLSFPANSS